MNSNHDVRIATMEDTESIGKLLHAFNSEYDDVTPGPAKIAERFKMLLGRDDITVLLVGDGPDGIAVLRFRPSLWVESLESYLAELYVAPNQRGKGMGRALMRAAMDAARAKGANYMDLCTSEDDVAARRLYESCGFTNHENGPNGPIMYFYETDL